MNIEIQYRIQYIQNYRKRQQALNKDNKNRDRKGIEDYNEAKWGKAKRNEKMINCSLPYFKRLDGKQNFIHLISILKKTFFFHGKTFGVKK